MLLKETRRARAGGAAAALAAATLGVAALPAVAATSAVVTPTMVASLPGAAVFTRPSTGSFVVDGRAYGHSIGMSQIGAIGAARMGVSATAILAHYYPGSVLTKRADTPLRVLLLRAGRALTVTATPGVRLLIPGIAPVVLPTGPVAWRLTALATGQLALADLPTRTGSWVGAKIASGTTALGPNLALGSAFAPAAAGTVGAPLISGVTGVRVENPDGSTATEPGAVTVFRPNLTLSSTRIVLTTRMETYLRGVVGQEIGPGSPAAAQQAQTVAARSYAARWAYFGALSGRTYDICDTPSCQDFPGIATGTVAAGAAADRPRLYPSTDAAVLGTAGQMLTYQGVPIDAMYGASNGGYTRSGGLAYLPAQPDPWDGLIGWSAHAWSATLPTSVLEAAWPGLGSLTRLQVVGRDGHGDLGGRATGVLLDFCTSTKCTQVQTSPDAIGSLYDWPDNSSGLRSSWWLPRGMVSPAAATTPQLAVTAPSALPPGQSGVVKTSARYNGIALAAATVLLQVQPSGATGWTTVDAGATSTGGEVTLNLPGQSGAFSWRVSVPGDGLSRLAASRTGSTTIEPVPVVTPLAGAVAGYSSADRFSAEVTFLGAPVTAPIAVAVAPPGGTTWQPIGTVATDATGTFAVILPGQPANYRWRVLVPGDGATRPATTVTGLVQVRVAVWIAATASSVPAGAHPILTGRILPVQVGCRAVLRLWNGVSYVAVASTPCRADGSYSVTDSGATAGSRRYQVIGYPPAGQPNLPGFSRVVSVQVG